MSSRGALGARLDRARPIGPNGRQHDRSGTAIIKMRAVMTCLVNGLCKLCDMYGC